MIDNTSTYCDLHWRNGDFAVDSSGDLALDRGLKVVQTDLRARLTSPRGSHWAWPEEGADIRLYLNATSDPLTLLALRQDIEIEVVRDVRVLDAQACLTTDGLRSGHVNVVAELTDAAALKLNVEMTDLISPQEVTP